jgi:hypothetical protein
VSKHGPPKYRQIRFWLIAGAGLLVALTITWILLLWMFGQ